MTTPAQKRAQSKYMANFIVARVRMDKDFHQRVKERAAMHGESINGYINRLIEQDMKQGKV